MGAVVTEDPLLVRRARAARLARTGQRTGYALLGLAVVGFLLAFFTGFPGAVVTAVTVALAAGSVVLAPSIVLGYAVKAAAREEGGR